WTDLTLQDKRVGKTAIYIFALAVLLAFLVLAAQYNSWSLPFAVLVIAPKALVSGNPGGMGSGGANKIKKQIGLLVL
ncbi:efflux RND transporter permease subunit, partial [Pseudomonas aeruginosa]|uniref:efflux RND transporter permease subunit n=1 Tax=Pseudomonas aeruginosa TaxID=287 RepID=UPI003CC5773E